jgi:hypothetical protein
MSTWAISQNHPFSQDPRFADDVRFAWRSLMMLCAQFGVDPFLAAGRRRKDDAIKVRKLWFNLTRPFITGTMLSKITGFNRSTIEDDTAEVERWRRANPNIDEALDKLTDQMESARSVIETADDVLFWIEREREYERAPDARPAPLLEAAAKPQAAHPYVSIIAKYAPLTRILGPIASGKERPEGAMAWASVADSVGAEIIHLDWAGHRDLLRDALPHAEEALRRAGKRVSMAIDVTHPTLKMKYRGLITIGSSLGNVRGAGSTTR